MRSLQITQEVEKKLRRLARDGYPLLPWTWEAAEDFGLFTATPQPTNEEIRIIMDDLRRNN